MNVSNVGRQCKRKPRLPVLFGNKNGTKEPSPRIERHRPFHTRSIALALAILITFGLFSPLCVAATPSYEIDSGNIVGSQNIGTLNGYNLYLVNISKQYDTIKLQEGNDSSTGELVSFLYGDGDYDGITGGSITRNSTNFKKTATYFQKEKSNISAVTFSEQSDYLLCRLTEFDWVVTFAPVTVGYILIAWEKAASVDKTALDTKITEAKNKNSSNCKTENDRYNAGTKAVSEKGFWSDFQAALSSAKSVNENPAATRQQVDSALEALTAAMANLIPIGQINPTNLYETIERCKKSNDDLKGCTEKTVNAYRTALTEANAYLDALFQKNAEGVVEPTAENVETNQGKADGYATTLSKATAELAPTMDRFGSVSLALDAIPALCELADKAISNTALNGCDTLKTKRDAAYAVWQKYAETQLNLNASEYKEIRTAYRDLFDAYYLGLTNTAESITVNVRVTDSASLKDPDFYHVDSTWTSTTWTGSVTLTGDQTLGALETQLGSKLYNKGRQDGFGAVSYAAIINGVYPHSLQRFGSYFTDDYYENGTLVYYSDRYVLHDGDTVELALLPQPTVSSYVGEIPLDTNYT